MAAIQAGGSEAATRSVEPRQAGTQGALAQLTVDAGAAAILESSRRRMNGGDLSGARAQLEVCKALACWAEVESLWGEVRDRVVYQEQERAGRASD